MILALSRFPLLIYRLPLDLLSREGRLAICRSPGPSFPSYRAAQRNVCFLPTEARATSARERWGRHTSWCLLWWLWVLHNQLVVHTSLANTFIRSLRSSEASPSPVVLMWGEVFLRNTATATDQVLSIFSEVGSPPSPERLPPYLQPRTYGCKQENQETRSGRQTAKHN